MRTTSLSNLHQLALGAVGYAGDNSDTLPPYRNQEIWLLWHDPHVTTPGIPTDSQDPAHLVECLLPYLGNSKSIFFCPTDMYIGTDVTFGFINHNYSSYGFAAWSDNVAANLVYPAVVTMTSLGNRSILFAEPWGFRDKALGSYWSDSRTCIVYADASAKAQVIEGKRVSHHASSPGGD